MIEVKLLTPTGTDDASIKAYLAQCVSVVRNKQPKDNERLFERLMKESAGNKPSRVFEFIPCAMDDVSLTYPNIHSPRRFGFLGKVDGAVAYRTTARELLNLGFTWDEVLMHVDFTDYYTVQLKVPYFIYGQLSTHTQITSVSHSARYSESGMGYWMPDEVRSYLSFVGHGGLEEAQAFWNYMVMNTSPKDLQVFMRDACGIKRREVWARGSDMLAYRTSTLGGYMSDAHAWPHFFLQRACDPHTQKETKEVAQQTQELLYSYNKTLS